MLELGESSIALHEHCGRAIAASGLDSLVTIGGEPARALGRAAVNAGMSAVAVVHATTSVEAADVMSQLVTPGDVVLVKGSRGIRTETVVERLVAEWA
jgi:UDP-N-acetylmuramoyl-tripeptide--D-alanyl-D-alanine ligase